MLCQVPSPWFDHMMRVQNGRRNIQYQQVLCLNRRRYTHYQQIYSVIFYQHGLLLDNNESSSIFSVCVRLKISPSQYSEYDLKPHKALQPPSQGLLAQLVGPATVFENLFLMPRPDWASKAGVP